MDLPSSAVFTLRLLAGVRAGMSAIVLACVSLLLWKQCHFFPLDLVLGL